MAVDGPGAQDGEQKEEKTLDGDGNKVQGGDVNKKLNFWGVEKKK